MTQALCLSCGSIKFGALCPCGQCQAGATGNVDLDIAFSDHFLALSTLQELGAVVAAIQALSDDRELCFWAFIHHVSTNHPQILTANLQPAALARVQELLAGVSLPPVTVHSGRRTPTGQEEADPNDSRCVPRKRWWQFWK
jgi:hypothetical protein